MKKLRIILSIAMLVPSTLSAQFFVDNLSNPVGFTASLRHDFWHATSITTGSNPNGYILEGIQTVFFDSLGSPSDYQMKIAEDSMGGPAMAIETLSGPTPNTSGQFGYASTGLFLNPNATYWVIHTSLDSDGSELSLDLTSATSEFSADSWTIGDTLFTSVDQGLTWEASLPDPSRFGVEAMAVVPEVTDFAVYSTVGLLAFVVCRRVRNGATHCNRCS